MKRLRKIHGFWMYERIALACNVPEHGLSAGDVATIVDFVDHPREGEAGCILEVYNAVGEMIAIAAVPLTAVEPLRPDEVLSVRPLSGAA